MSVDNSTAIFKVCGCGAQWSTRDAFLEDPSIRLIGYQADFAQPVLGLLLFNHSCGTTMGVDAEKFVDLYDGPVYDRQLKGTDSCPGYCLHKDALTSCPAKCECAYIREILQIVREWPKRRTAS